jgi:predicted enzyme related to lactoylglutathione lyase
MTSNLVALSWAANDPGRLGRFWADVLGRETAATEPTHGVGGIAILPRGNPGFPIVFVTTQEAKSGPNVMHLHLTSTSLEDQRQTVDRVLGLGGRHLDVGQRPEEGHVVLADPEGNELCVTGPDSSFLAGCGFLGELACDGSREVGLFWSEVLAWPLVWDQDEETAIQSPAGGTKISWGGPPLDPRTGPSRMHLDVAPPVGGNQQAEVDRLVALGATRVGTGKGDVSRVVLADPDGNEFCLLTPR